MYKFLVKYFHRRMADILIVLWYLFLIILNIYCGLSAVPQGVFRYVGW